MNCKQGDLAVIVRARHTPQILGHIIKIIGPFHGGVKSDDELSFIWEVSYADGRPIPTMFTDGIVRNLKTRPYDDAALRPIRDTDGEDETLTWAGKPEKVAL